MRFSIPNKSGDIMRMQQRVGEDLWGGESRLTLGRVIWALLKGCIRQVCNCSSRLGNLFQMFVKQSHDLIVSKVKFHHTVEG